MSEVILARSADVERGIPGQRYEDHVSAVVRNALFFANEMLRYSRQRNGVYKNIVDVAATLHDLGKVDVLFHSVMSGERKAKPLNHVDAGIAVLIEFYRKHRNLSYLLAAIIVHGHHIGFMNKKGSVGFTLSGLKADPSSLRDDNTMEKYLGVRNAQKHTKVRSYVDRTLVENLKTHSRLIDRKLPTLSAIHNIAALDLRMLAACLVAGDHGDAAHHMRYPSITSESQFYDLRPGERRKQLERKVLERFGRIKDHSDNPRNASRLRLFRAAKLADLDHNFYAVQGPVGSAKTLAKLELALRLAEKHDLRRILSIAPFNVIIDQTIEAYRDYLTLPDEDIHVPEIIAAHHCNHDYGSQWVKSYNVNWASPVVVTSAVQTFETLASNVPSRIKKSHNLAGSVIVLDEWHSMLPVALWGLASMWLHRLVEEWGCKVIYGSGTPVDYWHMPILQDESIGCIAQVAPECIVTYPTAEKQLKTVEKRRVRYEDWGFNTVTEMTEKIFQVPGPRLVVCDTVQNAALLAHYISMSFGREKVEHLSSAICPVHRKVVMNRIKERLSSGEQDWALVATSCVESGVDFSFRNGFAEKRSLQSTLQVSGRVNRSCEYSDSSLYLFDLHDPNEGWITRHPGFVASRRVLQEMIAEGFELSPENCSVSVERELGEDFQSRTVFQKMQELARGERTLSLKEVDRLFRVIVAPTCPVLVNEDIFMQFKEGALDCDKRQDMADQRKYSIRDFHQHMQEYSIGIFQNKIDRGQYPVTRLTDVLGHNLFETNSAWETFNPERIMVWSGGYDAHFLGFMNEILFRLGVDGVERAHIPYENNA